MSTIGLIAGGGRFPLLFAESARRAGHRVVAVAHRNETDPALERSVDAITWVKLGQVGHILEALRAGGAVRSDDNLLRAIAAFLEDGGVPITDPTPYLRDRLAPAGVLGKHA